MRKLLPFFSFLLLLAACKDPVKPVTKAEALALADNVENSIRARNPAVIDGLLDADLMIEKMKAKGGIDRALTRGLKQSFNKLRFGTEILASERGAMPDYRMVKVYEKAGRMHMLFRLYGTAGINYHDFELLRKNGKVRAADVYLYLSGEDFSKTLLDLFQSLNGADDISSLHAGQVKQMRRQLNEGHPDKAAKLYTSLPASFTSTKAGKLSYITICAALNDDARYIRAIEDYRDAFGNEPNIALVMVDVYITRKDWPAAQGAINELDSFIDKDPFLDYLRGNVSTMAEDHGAANTYLTRLHAAMPGFEDGFIELINNSMERGDEKRARELLQEYKSNKTLKQGSLDVLYSLHPEYDDAT